MGLAHHMARQFAALVTFGAVAAAAPPATADEVLLKLLDDTGFFGFEDKHNPDLRTRVAQEGIDALYSSNRIIVLDAEELAEGGFQRRLVEASASLEARGFKLDHFEEIETEDGGQDVVVNGRRYRLYDGADLAGNDDLLWTKPSLAFWQAVNDNIAPGSPEKFYLLNEANDLAGLFLDERVYRYWTESPSLRPGDKPYAPNAVGRSPFLASEPSWGWKAHEELLRRTD
jgi:hypothetical protein